MKKQKEYPTIAKRIHCKQFDIIEIKWLDSSSVSEWVDDKIIRATLRDQKPLLTTAYYYCEDEIYLTIIQTYEANSDNCRHGCFMIPKLAIISMRKIGSSEK